VNPRAAGHQSLQPFCKECERCGSDGRLDRCEDTMFGCSLPNCGGTEEHHGDFVRYADHI
jgi:hypothetical protein